MELGKEVLSSAVVPWKRKAITTQSSRENIEKQIRRKKSTGCWGYRRTNHRQHAQEQKAEPADRKAAREVSLLARETSRECHRFSFLDVEERARLSMPSFLASSEKRQEHNPRKIVKHRDKQQRVDEGVQ